MKDPDKAKPLQRTDTPEPWKGCIKIENLYEYIAFHGAYILEVSQYRISSGTRRIAI